MRRHWFDICALGSLAEDGRFRDSIELWVSEGFFDRFCGIFKCHGDPVLLRQCNAVHSMGLAKPIFVVFLDSDLMVLSRPRVLRPWSVACLSAATHVLESYGFPELAPGERLNLRIGGI